MNVWIVIPAYNEERMIGDVIDGLHRNGWKNVIVVDDGSKDRTAEIAKSKNAVVISHRENMGLGAALRTGISKAKELKADVVVTFDADGQHDPEDVEKVVAGLDGADLVIGARKFIGIPLNKRIGNFVLNVFTRLLGGPFVDSQSGLRAFGAKALKEIQIRSNRYVVSSEIIVQAGMKKLKIKEVPVKCYFTSYSKARGTTIFSGVRIAIELLKLRFAVLPKG
ncbi:MAG: glycosyltransferase family 2 protein [Candidatus Hadarchaeales archaeon]